MTVNEIKEILKKNLPEEFRDQVDEFAAYLVMQSQDEINALVDLVLHRSFSTARKRILATLSSKDVLQDMTTRNDLWAVRIQLRFQKKAEFQAWLSGLLKALITIGISKLTEL